jgi:hypothetical protein
MTTLIKATAKPTSIPSGSATKITLAFAGAPKLVSITPTHGFTVAPHSHPLATPSPDSFDVTVTRDTSTTKSCVLLLEADGSPVHVLVSVT